MKIFIIRTFNDRDYVTNVVLSSYVFNDKIMTYCDKKFRYHSSCLL